MNHSRIGRLVIAVAVVALVATGTPVLPGQSGPDPAAAFDNTISFTGPEPDVGGTFVPDGSGGWIGAIGGSNLYVDPDRFVARRVTINAQGNATVTNTIEGNAYDDVVGVFAVGMDGSVALSRTTGTVFTSAETVVTAYAPDGTVRFSDKPFESGNGGFLNDGRLYSISTTGFPDYEPQVAIYDSSGTQQSLTNVGAIGNSWQHVASPDGLAILSSDGLYEFNASTLSITRQKAREMPTVRALAGRGDKGYHLIVGNAFDADLETLDRDFNTIATKDTPFDAQFVRMTGDELGNAVFAWGAWDYLDNTSDLYAQHVDTFGDFVGEPFHQAVPVQDQYRGPATLASGGAGKSLLGWLGSDTYPDPDAFIVDSSVDAVEAVIEFDRDYTTSPIYPASGDPYFQEFVEFDGRESQGLPGDPIAAYNWEVEAVSDDAPEVDAIELGEIARVRFRTPPFEQHEYRVKLEVVTDNLEVDVATVELVVGGPAKGDFANIAVEGDPETTGGAIPEEGYTDRVVLEYVAGHEVAALANAETTVEWDDPDAVGFPTVTGDTEIIGLPPYRTLTGVDLFGFDPDETLPPHTRSRWQWTPLKSGFFEATFTTTFTDPNRPDIDRRAVEKERVTLNGARVETTIPEGHDDPENPASLGIGEPGTIPITFENTGYGEAEVNLTVPELEGYDMSVDEEEFDLAVGETAIRTISLSSNRAGPVTVPLEVVVTDDVTFEETRNDEIEAYVNIVSGFEWSVPERIEKPELGVVPELIDAADEFEDVQHETFPVDVTLTEAEDCTDDFDWMIDRLEDDPDDPDAEPIRTPVELEPTTRTDCTFRFDFDDEGVYDFDVSVEERDVAKGVLEVQDVLWVVLGDSVASGEGNPDRLGGFGEVGWADPGCHRSARSGAAQAAYDFEEASDQTSVTLVHLACSGARMDQGLLGPQDVTPLQDLLLGNPRDIRPAQLDVLDALIGDREPDVTVLHIGGNDVRFGPTLTFCANQGDIYTSCSRLGYSESRDLEIAGGEFIDDVPVPIRLDPMVGPLCLDTPAGNDHVFSRALTPTDSTLRANPNQGTGWSVVLNSRGTDFRSRNPVGRQDYGPPPGPDKEEFAAGETEKSNCVMALSPENASGDDFRIPLEGTTASAHYNVYTKPDGTVPLPGLPNQTTKDDWDWVSMKPPTLDERMNSLVNGDPDTTSDGKPGLAVRYSQVADELDDIGVPAESVLAVEYYDPVGGDDGEPCERVLYPPFSDEGVGLLANESEWARSDMLNPLNQKLAGAAAATNAGDEQGWTYVGGVAAAFSTHGYCASNSYIVTAEASFANQGDPFGIMHPNGFGHAVLNDYISDAVEGVVSDPSAIDAVDPSLSGQLARAVEAGSRVIEVLDVENVGGSSVRGPGDTVGLGAATTATLDTQAAEEFAVGDWIVVGAGSIEFMTAGEPIMSEGSVHEIVAVDGSRIEVMPPLGADRLAGERVALVPDRSLVDDPYVPGEPSDPDPDPPGGGGSNSGGGSTGAGGSNSGDGSGSSGGNGTGGSGDSGAEVAGDSALGSGGSGSLPFTGYSPVRLVLVGLALLGAGAALVSAFRRRRLMV